MFSRCSVSNKEVEMNYCESKLNEDEGKVEVFHQEKVEGLRKQVTLQN